VLPILFAIYISRVFEEVESKIGAIGLSFMDNISRIVLDNNIKEIIEILEEYREIALEWAQ
jgi:hypothetical protein